MRKITVCLALLATLSGAIAAEVSLSAAAKNVEEIVAHRGASIAFPENTLEAYQGAIDARAHLFEIDLRRTKDGKLVSLHDNTVDRTTNSKGPVGDKTLHELRALDAGSWYSKKFKGARIPTFREILETAGTSSGVLIDLKSEDPVYRQQIVSEIQRYGDPKRILFGVRSVAAARFFRGLLPDSRQIGLIPDQDSIEAFARAGVETIRLWPRWLSDASLVPRVRRAGAKLHIGAGAGSREEVEPLLAHKPESLSSDDPARLIRTLKELAAKGQ
jgi:glycerophosphoryl diester phosphodiesterase